ncbi:MAG TPA: DNA primase [Candidatus Paceibacterota bacterium]|nr:DNA primase [Candidatus Paceibacterota bacterium]
MASSVEQIKSKLSIFDVVSSYMKLEKAGINYRGCCPFHNEKTPSFFVSPARGSYHCFGCNRGGDIISFVQEIEGLDFLEALKSLAERAGVELEPLTRVPKIDNRFPALLDEATNFYFKQLVGKPEALAYLYERGLSKETIKTWRLGFAPDTWRSLSEYLLGRGYREDEMLKTGVVVAQSGHAGQGRAYDRFRSRIMFPLFNPNGKVVGFSGRIFGEKEETAKYINSPQTELYDKSRILYGYDRAKQAMRQRDFCIFVEGQMDLLMSHQAGVTNAVAVSGTAMTSEHVQLVKRLTDNVVLAYDYDLAGLSASRRAIDLLRSEGLSVKIAKLPSGQDPAEVIKANPDIWLQAIKEAKHYIDFMIDASQEEGKKGLDLNLAVNTYILPYVKALDKKMEQAHFVVKLANLLNIGEEAIWSDLQKIKTEPEETKNKTPEEILPVMTRSRMIEERLFGLYFLLLAKGEEEKVDKKLEGLFRDDNFIKKKEGYQESKDQLALAAELLYDPTKDLLKEMMNLASAWQEERLKEELQEALRAVHLAEKEDQTEALALNLKKCQELTLAINNLKKSLD